MIEYSSILRMPVNLRDSSEPCLSDKLLFECKNQIKQTGNTCANKIVSDQPADQELYVCFLKPIIYC